MTIPSISWTTDTTTAITSCQLTSWQLERAKVLDGPSEVARICEIDLDGEQLWGHVTGQVVNRRGLQLSPIVYPTYNQALRAKIADSYGPEATAAKIDRDLTERAVSNEPTMGAK